jgi:hypothetical protein
MIVWEPLAKVLPFMVRYLTTNGESAVYNPTPPFALRYRRARRDFYKRLFWLGIWNFHILNPAPDHASFPTPAGTEEVLE